MREHTHQETENPICPLCGLETSALVNCGAHENEFTDACKMDMSRDRLGSITGKAAENAYNVEERDCLICPQCRSGYLQMPSLCPLFVLHQGMYSYLAEQKQCFGREDSESIDLLLRNAPETKLTMPSLAHRFKILSSFDDIVSEIYPQY